jgi:hypothetical protein
MLAIQLKNYLTSIKDDANIMIYVAKANEERQLLFSDFDVNSDGNLVIDAEYEVPVRKLVIERGK